MAYDGATRTVVLFAGDPAAPAGDTWAWDGTTWTEQAPATRPPGLQAAGMAYDAATGSEVLFGGWYYTNGEHDLRTVYRDSDATWTWK
ncbi:MAG TPA: hypothetical protein VGH27_11100 [Streptosporangiaceae bacterium]|jgi:hypothetical protein